jgi:hypothetical protein
MEESVPRFGSIPVFGFRYSVFGSATSRAADTRRLSLAEEIGIGFTGGGNASAFEEARVGRLFEDFLERLTHNR